MKRLRPNFHLLKALYGFAGIVFGAAVANATVIFTDNFEGAVADAVAAGAGTGGAAALYAYGSQGGWTQVRYGTAGNSSWWYSTQYTTTFGGNAPGRPDPLGPASPPYDTNGQGSTALHGLNAAGFGYTYRTLGTAFVPGDTYRFSISASTDNGLTGQGVFLYFFRGSAVPASSFDAESSAAVGFESSGVGNIVNNSGGAIANIVAGIWDSSTNEGNWQTESFDFTPNASMAGENIGIAIYIRARTAVDNIQVEHFPVPEPAGASLTVVTAAGLLLNRRRKRPG